MPGIGAGIYRDLEGNVYRVICEATHVKTQDDLVVYEDVTDDSKKWALPASVWNEEVFMEGKTAPRFQCLAGSLWQLDAKPLFKLIEAIKTHMEMYDRMSEDNDIAFYERATGEVITVSRGAMGSYEGGEDAGDYPPKMMRDIERICGSPDLFVRLPDGDELDEYTLMEKFTYEVPIKYQDELERAIQGKGAFRRFKDTVMRLGIRDDWYEYKNAAYRKEAREWCDYMKLPWGKELLGQGKEIS